MSIIGGVKGFILTRGIFVPLPRWSRATGPKF